MPAEGRFYYERSVARGAEDYYSGSGEEQGEFVGRGAQALGWSGELVGGDLEHVFEGTYRPGETAVEGEREHWYKRREMVNRKRKPIQRADGTTVVDKVSKATAAFDLMFAAPKSASVLWALTEGDTARAVRSAHDEAVRQAFDYLERTVCATRRGHAGAEIKRGEGFVGAAYFHRTSRAGDPQLHTHVLVANATRADGRFTSLHAQLIFYEAKTAGMVYQAVLRAELSRSLGVRWSQPVNGQSEIIGIDKDLCQAFSKRSQDRDRALAEMQTVAGPLTMKRKEAAVLATRKKKLDVEFGRLQDRWLEEATAHDFGDVMDAVPGADFEDPVRMPSAKEIKALAGLAFGYDFEPGHLRNVPPGYGRHGLTTRKSTFRRRDLIQLAADYMQAGATAEQIELVADAILEAGGTEVVMLAGGPAKLPDTPSVRADGTTLVDHRADKLFTTAELLGKEQQVMTSMKQREGDGVAMVDARKVTTTLDARPDSKMLGADQRSMVESLLTSGHGMQVVVGLGGAGKTFSFSAANELWSSQGVEVRGCSTGRQAAMGLERETGIQSETIAQLKLWTEGAPADPDSGRPALPPQRERAFPQNGVLVVDEAGMVSTRDMAFLIEGADANNCKVILVGDHHQLPEIEAGGTFRGLVHRFEDEGRVERLLNNRRQRDAGDREMLAELRAGDVGKAIGHYLDHGKIVTNPDEDALRRQLAQDWLETRNTDLRLRPDGTWSKPEVAMIAYTRDDVQTLNRYARAMLDEQGALGSQRVMAGSLEIAVGDDLLLLKNKRNPLDPDHKLINGQIATVTQIGRKSVTLTDRDGRTIPIPLKYLAEHASYGYATTGHKAQGMTVDGDAFVLASGFVSRNWMYVAMSRAKDESRIYVDTVATDPKTGEQLTPREQLDLAAMELYDLACRPADQQLATDYDTEHSRLSNRELQWLSKREDLSVRERGDLIREQSVRTGRLRDELVGRPPEWLRATIGGVPLDKRAHEGWARAALQLEQHREQRGLKPQQMLPHVCERVLGRSLKNIRDKGFGRPDPRREHTRSHGRSHEPPGGRGMSGGGMGR